MLGGRDMPLNIPQCPLVLTPRKCKVTVLSISCCFNKVEARAHLGALSYASNSVSFKRTCLKSWVILKVCSCTGGKARLH